MALNFLGHMAAQAVNKLYPLLVYPFAQARLSTVPLGQALFAVSLVDWTSPFIDSGTAALGQIEVGKAQGDAKQIAFVMGRIHALRLLHAVLALIALHFAVIAFYGEYRAMVAAISFMLLTTALDGSYVLVGRQRILVMSVLAVTTKLAALAAVFTLVRGPDDATTFAVIMVLANSLFSLGVFAWSVKEHGFAWPTPEAVRSLYRLLWPFFIIGLGLYGLDKFDLLIVEALHAPIELGAYAAASRLYIAVAALVPALALAFGAEMLSTPDKPTMSRHVRLASGVVSLAVMPVVVGVFFTAPDILTLLYDAEVASAGRPLALMCLGMIPQAVIVIIGVYVLSILGFASYVARWLMLGLAAGVGFALALDGSYGLPAIAAGIAVAKSVSAVGLLWRARFYLEPGWSGPAWRNALAALVMGGVLWVAQAAGLVGLWPTVALGAAVYMVAAYVLNREMASALVARITRR